MTDNLRALLRNEKVLMLLALLGAVALTVGVWVGAPDEKPDESDRRAATVRAPQLAKVGPKVAATYSRKTGFPSERKLNALLKGRGAASVELARLGKRTVRLCEPARETVSCLLYNPPAEPVFVAGDTARVAKRQVAAQLRNERAQRRAARR